MCQPLLAHCGKLSFVPDDPKASVGRVPEFFRRLLQQLPQSLIHHAKGLEFRAVVVMACDDEVVPLQQRIETVGEDSDLREFYDTERHLLYMACTRARDHSLVTSVEPGSEFLDDMRVPIRFKTLTIDREDGRKEVSRLSGDLGSYLQS